VKAALLSHNADVVQLLLAAGAVEAT